MTCQIIKNKEQAMLKLYSSLNPDLYLLRNVFGVINVETGRRYLDLRSSFLELRRLSYHDLEDGIIQESKDRGKCYRLLVDQKLIDHIESEGEAKAMVSFQIRESATFRCYYIAVARLFEDSRVNSRLET